MLFAQDMYRRMVDLISDALPFSRLWYTEIPHAIGYARPYEHKGDFKEW
jgi:hypothetical protein